MMWRYHDGGILVPSPIRRRRRLPQEARLGLVVMGIWGICMVVHSFL